MSKKKGRVGQKKVQGQKAKSIQKAKKMAKAKTRLRKNKAVKTNLKKITLDKNEKINLLNKEYNQFLMTSADCPSPPSTSQATSSKPIPDEDHDMPDVGSVSDKIAKL